MLKAVFGFILLTFSLPYAFAQSGYGLTRAYVNEASISLSEGRISFGNSSTTIKLGGSYSYMLDRGLQAGVDASFASYSGSNSLDTTYISIFATGTVNFPMERDIRQAAFAKVGFGFSDLDSPPRDKKSEFGFKVYGGKRFPIWDHIEYAPMGGIYKIGSRDAVIEIIPLNITAVW